MNTSTNQSPSRPAPSCQPPRRTSAERRCAVRERDARAISYLPLVHKIAHQVQRRTRDQTDIEELVAWGTTGLLEAMDRYVEGGKASLGTFAYYRIRGAMLDGIGHVAPLSRKCYRQAARRGDFHAIYGADCEPEAIPDPRDGLSPEDFTAENEIREVLFEAITRLPPQQQHLVRSHYFENQPLNEAGKHLGISKSWASRAHANALANLREEMQESVALAC